MSSALTPGLQVSECARISRHRDLPVKGTILVQVGDRVSASQRVGEASLQGDLYILRVPEKMGIEPFEVMRGIRVSAGQQVAEGEVLCEHSGLFGLFRSKFSSPYSGMVEFITERTGHIGLRLPPRPFEINAYLSGVVTRIDPGKSVTIESVGPFVQGIFGVGGERQGTLHCLPVSENGIITIDALPADCSGMILAGGRAPSADVVRAAAARGAHGFITGSIDDRALAAYLGYDIGIALTGDEDISMTLIITEGFGEIPMGVRSWNLFSKFNGVSASINGATQVRAGAVRPEIVLFPERIATTAAASSSVGKSQSLSIGSKIRIIRVPHFGITGEILELPPQMVQIETGAFARVLRVRLEDGNVLTVPRANVELFE